ncbi:hypothetical protein MATL_G00015290 [Megalops atlanticus]|uniref:Uncharacterized protein n=1 Tax=Megalops atlanticus TaxID=7932 RepID=A0A9D3TEB9_MEGAT|nr:hypothetical protein MATL_G00015290 [Megalops atlanticus]
MSAVFSRNQGSLERFLIGCFSNSYSELSTRNKITAIEKDLDTEDISFLKNYKQTLVRAQCTLQDPELLSGALIDVAKHLGNLKFRVWEKMLGIVQYSE